ncbi:N-formylglutamate amidohydrolase [Zunongwangia endophytica]|uniref:N-formylglutamate amidohydrolase n=1 Tax=Zunongwangia endophytica TaxID=1808945 RepID=A0ABV8HE35_9FLAO|nr:N-formylglutamate amidohydrolase [Zunongwangia endophytica]MDN3594124.1 N-formylglutamate amidohydrolase [Zunongwangia endophytica]
MKLILTCEHATNALPQEFSYLKNDQDPVWATHRAYDPGAFKLFQELEEIADFSFVYNFSRLLIEPNRSLHHPNLFSEYSKSLSNNEKSELINSYYLNYRNKVEKCISEFIKIGEDVIHISVHSFTPILNGVERKADIGLLYDPARGVEKDFAKIWKLNLSKELDLKVRFNYPYLGKADGFTTYLRNKFSTNYAGLELEVNQKFVAENEFSEVMMASITRSLKGSL